ncbi:keratin, type I cytoskeletal 18-like [Gopherus flavomarginatus]|uniref:keratin, type I cytoskeletal 18-like n=1 Tax=Gopherus flavomarginatus TaxID=286002 RepID=UPI0021CBE171|nr:keratin, type I cytoskeletal 18-like [Gopherus flavomarginatus]
MSRSRSGSLAGAPRPRPGSSAGSMYGGAGGSEPRVSASRLQALLPGLRANLDALWAGSQQEALQGLNERLAGYLRRVRGLEAANRALEEEIAQVRARRGDPGQRDWEACERPLVELRKQVEDLNMDNAKLLLQIDNARLAADDFKVKLEAEQATCDSVQKDTQGLRKIMEDTNFLRTKQEAELEGLKEELAHLRKSHKEEAGALRALIANSDVTVEVDNPKKQELSETIAQIRKQYEKVAEQNREDAESWYKDKFDTLSQEANVNTQALEEAKSELSELRRQLQGLEIERQTLQKMVDTQENSLENTEARYNDQLANLTHVIAKLQEELAACRADLERQARDYEALLDVKVKLENEISQYSQLIEGVIDRLPKADH